MNAAVHRAAAGALALLAGAALVHSSCAAAEPTVVVPTMSLSIFDEGGALSKSSNGGFWLGGMAVHPETGAVYALATDNGIGELSNSLQLIRTTGPQTAQKVGDPVPITLIPWAYDLTPGPGGLLYVAGAIDDVGGIFGLDPEGVQPVQPFASGTCTWATSGLTFAADGLSALVSTDGAQATCLEGLYQVWPDGSYERLIVRDDLPNGIPRGTDDHAVTLDGRVIVAGDKSHDLWDVTAGEGNVFVMIDFDDYFTVDDIPGWLPAIEVWGSRIAVDPVTGNLFYTHGRGQIGAEMAIIEVTDQGTDPRIVAEGFRMLRDIAFGPASSGQGRSLFVTELRDNPGGGKRGIVYEITMPAAEDTDGDGLADSADNCIDQSNPDQRDTDGDGIGNLCDVDLDNDCMVNFGDLAAFKAVFMGDDPDADFDGNGQIDFGDLAIMKARFLAPPGPSGLAGACSP